MKNLKQIRLVALILCAVLLFTACGSTNSTTASATTAATAGTTGTTTAAPNGTSSTTASTPTTTTAVPDFPVTVKNGMGEDVIIKAEPKSIVITNVWAAEILFELVDINQIKGLSMWNDKPAVTVSSDKAKAVEARVSTQRPEEIVALAPDLVVIDSFSDPDGSLAKTLTGAGAAVLSMASPTDFTMITAAISTLAKATGASEAGKAIIAEMEKTLSAVKAKTDKIAPADRVRTLFYESYYDQSGTNAGMLAAYGKGSTFDAIAEAAGLVNVCDAPNYSAISKEKIVGEWQPELLVVPSIMYNDQGEPVNDSSNTLIKAVLEDPLLKTLPAVQNKQVISLTETYRGSTSQYMAKAVEELAKAAYPELFN